MRYSVSDTAEHGDYTGGARLVTEETRREMQEDVAGDPGRHLREEVDRRERGGPSLGSTPSARASAASSSRKWERDSASMMPFLDAVEVTTEGDVKRTAAEP